MTYSAIAVSNSILRRSFRDGVPITLMKLQRITYFVASEYEKKTRRPLLDEQFQQWSYGPVLRSLHDKFSVFKGNPVNVYGKDAKGVGYCVDERADFALSEVLESIWEKSKHLPPVTLSRITHLPESAWRKAFLRAESVLDGKEIASDTSYEPILGLIREKMSA